MCGFYLNVDTKLSGGTDNRQRRNSHGTTACQYRHNQWVSNCKQNQYKIMIIIIIAEMTIIIIKLFNNDITVSVTQLTMWRLKFFYVAT